MSIVWIADGPKGKRVMVRFETLHGTFVAPLDANHAEGLAANLIRYAKEARSGLTIADVVPFDRNGGGGGT